MTQSHLLMQEYLSQVEVQMSEDIVLCWRAANCSRNDNYGVLHCSLYLHLLIQVKYSPTASLHTVSPAMDTSLIRVVAARV